MATGPGGRYAVGGGQCELLHTAEGLGLILSRFENIEGHGA
jgi:hypothetical protein